jgi:hypothetical protein
MLQQQEQATTTVKVADHIRVKPATLGRWALPVSDVMIGDTKCWAKRTIDDWQTQRPSRGRTEIDRGINE